MSNRSFLLLLFFIFTSSSSVSAYWVWSPESGKFVNPEKASEGTAEEEYNQGMELFKENNLDNAREIFEQILKKYPDARLAPEAQYRIGVIFEEQNDYLKAFKAYKKLVETYPQSERFNEVIEREFRIGNVFLSGKKAKFAGLNILPSLPRAAEVFEHIVKYAPFSDFGDDAQFHLGLTYKKWGRYAQSVDAFQALLDQHPQSPFAPQARFQLAETSFLRSKNEFRDQRALDEASQQVDRFLTRYPDSSASEKAAKLRQAIDEKNAEKNYRIGLYYEKENYVQSALIYYSDVAARYPQTVWGLKAAEKLKSLKSPADYLLEQEKDAEQEIAATEAKLQGATDEIEKSGLERQLERLKKHRKTLEKTKGESLERREQDLKRRERELKDKFKNLEKKKKLMKTNPSEDFKRAMERWSASLVSEQEQLEAEKRQLGIWHGQLGLREKKIRLDFLPFVGEPPSSLERVRRIEAKKFYKLSEEKKSVLEEKELLYKHHAEVASLLKQIRGNASVLAGADENDPQVQTLKAAQVEIARLGAELEAKQALYEKHYGQSSWSWKGVASSLNKSVNKSLDLLNPFGEEESRDPQRLLERRMHLKEKIAAQQALVQTLSDAFEAEIALQEQKRLLAALGRDRKADPAALRKNIKALEKTIRKDYEEIGDRHERKNKLLAELDRRLHTRETEASALVRTSRVASAPVRGTAKFFRAFFFGLPHREVELTKQADRVPEAPETAPIKKLEDEIKLESLVIETKSREIALLEKKLEVMKAEASLAGGYKFRPVLVQVPYLFLGEAIDSAKRLIPSKSRHEMLVTRLDRETKKLEAMKKELSGIEKTIPETAAPAAPPAGPMPDEPTLKKQIDALTQQLQIQQDLYQRASEDYRNRARTAKPAAAVPAVGGREKEGKLEKELKGIEGDLTKLIRKESDLENEEYGILEKRIQEIDVRMKKETSRLASQDLLTERERMEQRLSQLENRKDFLTKELKRFQFESDLANTGTRS